jgi:hypothetical protein
VDLLWDILREMGLLKKERPGGHPRPRAPKPRPPADRLAERKRAIEGEDPRKLARAISRMMRRKRP